MTAVVAGCCMKKKRHDEKSVKAVVFVIESRTTDSPLPVSVIVWSHRVILPFYRLLALLHYPRTHNLVATILLTRFEPTNLQTYHSLVQSLLFGVYLCCTHIVHW